MGILGYGILAYFFFFFGGGGGDMGYSGILGYWNLFWDTS